MNTRTYTNGNYTVEIDLNDGTKIRETSEDQFVASFAENIDIKICDHCDAQCKWCHEGSTPNNRFGNILTEPLIETLHPYQELAIGGGDPTSHPDLIPFLQRLKNKNVIANITVNQIHFMKKQEFIQRLIKENLIYGIGVSLQKPTPEFINAIKKYDNTIVHTINGILDESDIIAMRNHNIKILILGYKQNKRGQAFYTNAQNRITVNQTWLKQNIKQVIRQFKTTSFDNLAIEQLGIKSIVNDKTWNEFYMGDEGTSTFFIDLVERKFARNSTAPEHERYELLNSVDDMFNTINK